MRRKKDRSKQGQTNNKAKQHSTPKAVTFPKKNELSRVGLEPTTLYTPDGDWHIHVHVHTLCIAHCNSEARHGDLEQKMMNNSKNYSSFFVHIHVYMYIHNLRVNGIYIARRLHHSVHVI